MSRTGRSSIAVVAVASPAIASLSVAAWSNADVEQFGNFARSYNLQKLVTKTRPK